MKKIRLDVLSRVFSQALDVVEAQLLGASEHHSARLAALCAMMGRRLGYDDDSVSAIATCALFHDNALTEYILSEREGDQRDENMKLHCVYGQRNVEWLPFQKDIAGYVLCHHERADGSGTFGKKKGEYPREAGLIAIVDAFDVTHHLQRKTPGDLPDLRRYIESRAKAGFDPDDVDVLLDVFDEETLISLNDKNIVATLDRLVPEWTADVEDPEIIRISGMIARIIDYKSVFTKKHTIRIANMAWLMGEHYGYTDAQKGQIYLSAALHDIGKIIVPTEIVEKPGKFTSDEYSETKKHVQLTETWLKGVPGLEDIGRWASNHHEKLNGSGYASGKKADELDFNSRLITCMDIYEAVSADRPYHKPRTHEESMRILYRMAQNGEVDPRIARDIDEVMAPYQCRDLPYPPILQGLD